MMREALLVPLVPALFVLDPYLKIFVDRTAGGKYTFILHGSGANSGQWLTGRIFLDVRAASCGCGPDEDCAADGACAVR